MNSEVPCIIFLDSLKAHPKNVVAANVTIWLNHEWQKTKGDNDVFTRNSIKLFAPIGIVDKFLVQVIFFFNILSLSLYISLFFVLF